MILDSRLEIANGAAIALNVGNAILPNGSQIDLGASPTLQDIGAGQPLYLVLSASVAFAGSGATVQFQLASDSTANLATSKTVHIDTGAISLGTDNAAWAIAGYTKVYPLPLEATYERYLGIWMTVASANVTAGNLDAFITSEPSRWMALPDGI
jgi:hypothetical protein